MASEFLEAARREAETLRAELAENPVFQKLQIVQRTIESYEALEDIGRLKGGMVPRVNKPKPVAAARPGSKLAQVEFLVIAHTVGNGRRATSGQLLPVILDAGIEIGGQVPAKTLSSMLSNSSAVNNLPGYGYGPADWGNSPGPNAHKTETPPAEAESVSEIAADEPPSASMETPPIAKAFSSLLG